MTDFYEAAIRPSTLKTPIELSDGRWLIPVPRTLGDPRLEGNTPTDIQIVYRDKTVVLIKAPGVYRQARVKATIPQAFAAMATGGAFSTRIASKIADSMSLEAGYAEAEALCTENRQLPVSFQDLKTSFRIFLDNSDSAYLTSSIAVSANRMSDLVQDGWEYSRQKMYVDIASRFIQWNSAFGSRVEYWPESSQGELTIRCFAFREFPQNRLAAVGGGTWEWVNE